MLAGELLSFFQPNLFMMEFIDLCAMLCAASEVRGLEAKTTSARHSHLKVSGEQLQPLCAGAKRSRRICKPRSNWNEAEHNVSILFCSMPVSTARSPRAPQGSEKWAHKSMAETLSRPSALVSVTVPKTCGRA